MALQREDGAFKGLTKRDRKILGMHPESDPQSLKDLLEGQADKMSRRRRIKLDKIAKNKDIDIWEAD